MSASIKLVGANKFNNFLDETVKLLKNPTRFYARAGVIGLQDVQKHFNESMGLAGKWQELQYRKGKPLLLTGRLKNSNVFVYDSRGAEIGTNVVYAATHNYGDKKRNIPERKFLWLSDQAKDKIVDSLVKILEEEAK
jgi:phage gpG-like protein